MHRIEVNCETGDITEIPLTPEEIAEREAAAAEAEQLAAAGQVATPLTARERLEAAGFSIDELRELLSGGVPQADAPLADAPQADATPTP
jgi:hypothetical protein